MSVSRKGGSATRNVNAITAATKRKTDCTYTRPSNWLTSGILVLLKEFLLLCLRENVLAKNQNVGKTIATVSGPESSVLKSVNV